MKMFRNNEICVNNEVQFYIGLRRKQVIGGIEGASGITNDEVVGTDLRQLYTSQNPHWVIAWDEREKERQDHKKRLNVIENKALALPVHGTQKAPVVSGDK